MPPKMHESQSGIHTYPSEYIQALDKLQHTQVLRTTERMILEWVEDQLKDNGRSAEALCMMDPQAE